MTRKSRPTKSKEPPHEAKLRRLARLQVARADIDMARQMAEAANAMRLTKHDPTAWAFHYGVVVTYARPFKSNQSVGALEAKWSRFDDPALEANHRHLLTQRDEIVAHAELRWRPLVLTPPGTRLPNKVITVRPAIIGLRAILDPVSYPLVVQLCSDLLPRLNRAFDDLYLAMFPNGVQKPTHLLRTPEGEPGVHLSLS